MKVHHANAKDQTVLKNTVNAIAVGVIAQIDADAYNVKIDLSQNIRGKINKKEKYL